MIKEKNKWIYEGGKGQKKKIGQHPENGKSVFLIKRSGRKSEKLCAVCAILYGAQKDIVFKSLKQHRL